MGDVAKLAESIAQHYLINPITVTADMRLLAGERRLAAVRLLGWTEVEVRVIETLDDAATELRIERDENTERKAMTPSEMVALGMALEALERPKAAARMLAGKPPVLQNGGSDTRDKLGETRQIVADALGTSTSNYSRAKAIVVAADNPHATEEERAVARQAVKDMDSGAASVSAAYDRVASDKKIRLGRTEPVAIEGARLQRQGMKRSLPGLLGMATAFDLIIDVDPAITDEEIRQWVADLSKARRSIERLIKRLSRELSSEQAQE